MHDHPHTPPPPRTAVAVRTGAQQQLALSSPASGGRAVELILDGMTIRDSDGEEIATLTAAGWISPDGIATDRVRVPIGAARAVVDSVELTRQRRQEEHAWLEHAQRKLRTLAEERARLTVDEMWKVIEMPPRDGRNQMSQVMRAGKRDGLIALTGETVPCTRNNGGRRVRVWRSLIYDERGRQ